MLNYTLKIETQATYIHSFPLYLLRDRKVLRRQGRAAPSPGPNSFIFMPIFGKGIIN